MDKFEAIMEFFGQANLVTEYNKNTVFDIQLKILDVTWSGHCHDGIISQARGRTRPSAVD